MYKDVPYHVPAYLKKEIKRPKLEDISLFIFKNGKDRSPIRKMKPGQPYIPVYEDVEECSRVVKKLCLELRDDMFIICTFDSIDAIDERVRETFDEEVKLIIKESNR